MTLKREWDKEHIHLHATENGKDESNWAILADKAYIRGSDELRLIVPKRDPQRGISDLRSKESNIAISHDRIIVENYFGRMKSLWGLLSTKYRRDEDTYDTWMTLGVAMTNYSIHIRPLRAEDRGTYVRFENSMRTIGADDERRKRSRQEYYRRNKKRRNSGRSAIIDNSDD